MSISGIGGQAALSTIYGTTSALSAGNTSAALAALASGSGEAGLILNVDVAASGVSTALQDLSGALGSIIDITA